jgi:hypothetical protein
MKIYKVGDVVQAVCHTCKSVQDAVFKLSDVPLSDNSCTVKNVLVGFCKSCNEMIVMPQQSAPLINKKITAQKKSLETRVPAHMVDILKAASQELGASPEFTTPLIKYYLHILSEQEQPLDDLLEYLESDLAQGTSQKRISVKGRFVAEEVSRIKLKANIQSTTDIMKAIVLRINNDVLVKPTAKTMSELRSVAAAFS